MTPANQLIETLGALRRQWRQRVILESAVWIVVAAFLAVVAGVLITTLFGATTSSVMFMRGLGYVVIVVAVGLLFIFIRIVLMVGHNQYLTTYSTRAQIHGCRS